MNARGTNSRVLRSGKSLPQFLNAEAFTLRSMNSFGFSKDSTFRLSLSHILLSMREAINTIRTKFFTKPNPRVFLLPPASRAVFLTDLPHLMIIDKKSSPEPEKLTRASGPETYKFLMIFSMSHNQHSKSFEPAIHEDEVSLRDRTGPRTSPEALKSTDSNGGEFQSQIPRTDLEFCSHTPDRHWISTRSAR